MAASPPYRPISCDFHDLLEAAATRRVPADIVFLDAGGRLRRQTARITDLSTRTAGEYMTLSTGECIRFDRIVSINGRRLADFPG